MASYIIHKNKLVARLDGERKSGEVVKFAWNLTREALDASREYNLAGARIGVVSNAKKWAAVYAQQDEALTAREINPGEFYLG